MHGWLDTEQDATLLASPSARRSPTKNFLIKRPNEAACRLRHQLQLSQSRGCGAVKPSPQPNLWSSRRARPGTAPEPPRSSAFSISSVKAVSPKRHGVRKDCTERKCLCNASAMTWCPSSTTA
eukprot:CAMPEP_0180548844 /NCGR_PEP_ID=MMETSP1036_2-20121128/71812_1 /TAXON_ID=632150 /ORGANISM="Azadinium spinosum, Strain 3D9" /LENGTH=122 /DNA_ID=CAMNT_0022564025 /DNA_START=1 /DNA_END=369 /DNA_ORIENTATION=-